MTEAGALREWLIDHALPLWAGRGFDASAQRFEEKLTFEADAVIGVPLRLMVQARQIYVYAQAVSRGWSTQGDLVDAAFHSMVRDYYQGPSKGWIFSISRDGTIVDSKRDFYAHAFVLLAIAAYLKIYPRELALRLADETLDFLDVALSAESGGGYWDAVELRFGPRSQNPHMHLFEALLELWASTKEPKYLARAGEVFGLFTTRFFQPQYGVLAEHFDHGFNVTASPQRVIAEPGHHFEWVWLLCCYHRETGRGVSDYANSLYRHASCYGFDSEGLIVDEVFASGDVVKVSRRIWPLTEAIKAALAMSSFGQPECTPRIGSLISTLRKHFLTDVPLGGWKDRVDDRGQALEQFMPASALYHLCCAIGELDSFLLH